jgi:hypothetical protein
MVNQGASYTPSVGAAARTVTVLIYWSEILGIHVVSEIQYTPRCNRMSKSLNGQGIFYEDVPLFEWDKRSQTYPPRERRTQLNPQHTPTHEPQPYASDTTPIKYIGLFLGRRSVHNETL